jgi:hypothetical protein
MQFQAYETVRMLDDFIKCNGKESGGVPPKAQGELCNSPARSREREFGTQQETRRATVGAVDGFDPHRYTSGLSDQASTRMK